MMGKDKLNVKGIFSSLRGKKKEERESVVPKKDKMDAENNSNGTERENKERRGSFSKESGAGTPRQPSSPEREPPLYAIVEEKGANNEEDEGGKRKSPKTGLFSAVSKALGRDSSKTVTPRQEEHHQPQAVDHSPSHDENNGGSRAQQKRTPSYEEPPSTRARSPSPPTSPPIPPLVQDSASNSSPKHSPKPSPKPSPTSTPREDAATPQKPKTRPPSAQPDQYFDESKFKPDEDPIIVTTPAPAPAPSPSTSTSTTSSSSILLSPSVSFSPLSGSKKKMSGSFVPLPFVSFAPKAEASPANKTRSSGPPEISPEDIEKGELIGHGSFGSVYKGVCRGQDVAVKVPKKQKLTMAELTSFRNEVKMMSKIYHPNVVLFLGACTALGKMQIVTERCMTDVERLLAADKQERQFSLYRRMQMAKDAALGIYWLHGITGVVHHDLKTANLLVDHNLRVKVTDFGFSQIKEDINADKTKKGTPLWMAPEVMMGLNKKCDEKVDVYSFGIILWEILTRDVPYAHHSDYVTFFKAVCIDHERPPIPPDTLPSLTHLITSCWDAEPTKRPNFEEIIFRLNEVLVDCAIENEEGRSLWKQHFLLPKQELVEEVPWLEFDQVLRKHIGKYDINLEEIRNLIVSAPRDPMMKSKEVVTLEKFDRVIKWFGPFFSVEGGGVDIINEVNEMSKQSWFHRDIPKEEAMERLAKQEAGTFLIRLSSTDPKPTPFTLSMTGNSHRRIKRLTEAEDGTNKGYRIVNKPTMYNTLIELVEKNVDYDLRKACPKKGNDGYSAYDPYKEITV